MKKCLELCRDFGRNRGYMLFLAVTALLGYGFLVTHATVGVDDTPYAYYFEEGMLVSLGRWVLFLLNKVVHIVDFMPFLTDCAGVLVMMAAVTVWAALFCSILGEGVPGYGYCFFACIFLSCPLHAEVFPYHLHNGVAIGYLCCGFSLWCLREGFDRILPLSGEGIQGRRRETVKGLLSLGVAAVFLCIAIGCYESFMVAWLVGVCLLLLTERLAGGRRKCFRALCLAADAAFLALLFRTVATKAVIGAFGLGSPREQLGNSILEGMGWLAGDGAAAEFTMTLKRVLAMYGAFAYAYYPIKIYVLASGVILCFCLWRALRRKDPWIVLLAGGSFGASFLLVVVEGRATPYRCAQFLPLVCGYGALLLVYGLRGLGKPLGKAWGGRPGSRFALGALQAAPCLALCIVLWNQCAELNKWFYVDYLKYEDAKNTMNQIAYELEKGFDTSKPVAFTGTYELPGSILADAYIPYGSETFYKVNRWTGLLDEHLLDKFYSPRGVSVAQTPTLSVLDWGRYAFDGDGELARFFAMHGHEIVPCSDIPLYRQAEEYSQGLPHFPEEGSIVDMGDYIIVHY